LIRDKRDEGYEIELHGSEAESVIYRYNYGLDVQLFGCTSIRDGSAMAFLMGDYQNAKRQEIKGSPSYVIGDGRQTLYGNVGYRVILANIEELLKNPTDEASWC
jgi:predicted DsbA family dithiol-disulfide isomerase